MGIYLAQEIKPQARVLAEDKGMTCALVDYDALRGLDDRHRKLLAYGIVGMSESTCRHWLRHDVDLDADELAAQVAEMAWSGLRGLRPA